MGRYNEAIKWIEKAKNIDEAEGPSQRLATRYFNLGNCYMALKDYKQSKFYLEKSEAILDQTEYYSQASKVYASLGQLYMIIGSDDKAGICLLKSKELAEKGGTLPEKSNCYDLLYQYNKKFKRFDEALQFYELHTEAEDSIFNLKVSKQVEEMEAQYQTKQKEAEISRLEQENELKIKELSFRKRERNWAIAGALLFLIAAGSFFLLFSTVKKQKAKLSEQNLELDRLNKTLNKLFAIISHDLRNATAAYQSSAKVIQHHLEKGQPEKLLPIASEINANAKNLSSMLENLLQWSVMQLKGIKPRKEQLQSKDELEKIVELVRNDAVKKENAINIDSSADHSFYCDRESFSLIVRNLVGNAIKFTSKGEISITTEQTGQKTILTIHDTGCGMSKQMVERIFKNNKENIRQGTSGEKGTGLGLLMVKEHVNRNGGTISVESEEGKGTTFTVSLPLEHI
jgi:signal transduction histidine kinase